MQLLQVFSLAVFAGVVGASEVTPIQKVLEMMDGMLEKGKKDKHDEQVRFSAFRQFCESTKTEKDRAIKDAGDKITQLDADITKSLADAETLSTEIGALSKDIDTWTASSKKASAERKAEKKVYMDTHLDYSESIDALGRAIQVLKTRSKDVPQSLLQSQASVQKVASLKLVPSHARHVLASFLQAETGEQAGAPEANAYEFQSTSVVDMLEKLKIRFQDEKLALEKEEMNRKASFDMIMQKLSDDIQYAEETSSAKTAAKARAKQDAATATGDLAETKEAKEADETYLRDTMAECKSKSKDFETRQVTRSTEIEAIQKAIEIISSPEVSGSGKKYLPSAAALLETPRRGRSALAQLRATQPEVAHALQEKVVSLLLQRSREVKSELLASVAGRIGEDPFAKVKKMIKDLITKLMEEANQEADHKGFCDQELSTNKQTRDDKSALADQLTSKIDELTSKEAKLSQDISDLNDAVSEINKAVKEATELRQKEKAANTVTIADAVAASDAVTKAIKVLKDFYAKAATATAFTQDAQAPPPTFDEPYQGMQSENGGVVGMLEVIQSDFARLEAETSSSEDEAATQHDTFLAESAQDKEVKEKEARHKGFDKVRAVKALNQSKKDLKATQAELDAALEYYDKLKPQCVDNGLSYEERVQKRKEEIQSLQEALKVLSGTDI